MRHNATLNYFSLDRVDPSSHNFPTRSALYPVEQGLAAAPRRLLARVSAIPCARSHATSLVGPIIRRADTLTRGGVTLWRRRLSASRSARPHPQAAQPITHTGRSALPRHGRRRRKNRRTTAAHAAVVAALPGCRRSSADNICRRNRTARWKSTRGAEYRDTHWCGVTLILVGHEIAIAALGSDAGYGVRTNSPIGHVIERRKLLGTLLRRSQPGPIGDHEAQRCDVRCGKLGGNKRLTPAEHQNAVKPRTLASNCEIAQKIELQISEVPGAGGPGRS